MLIMLCVGLVIGFCSGKLMRNEPKKIGAIRIDRSDPDGPFLFLELDVPIYFLEKQRYATVRIIPENYRTPRN